MANTIIQTFLTQLLLAKETTFQTGTTASGVSVAAKNPKANEIFESLYDQGYRGHAAMDYGYFQGVGHAEIDLPDMWFYAEDYGHFFMAMLGTDGTTSGTHFITLFDGLPPSYSLTDYNGIDARQYSGLYFSEMTMKWANPGRLTLSAKAAGMTATSVAKPAFPTYSAAGPYLPWQMASTINGVATNTIINMELSLKRKVETIWGMTNSQQPNLGSDGPLEVTGKIDFAAADSTQLNLYKNNTQPAATFTFTGASTTNTMTLHFNDLAFETPTIMDRSKDFLVLQSTFRGIYNATDAGSIKVTLINARTSTY